VNGAAPTPSLLSYRSLIWNFAQRDLKSRFKGTAIGWGWSLILPLATLGIYTLITHYIFRAVPPDFGNGRKGNFAVFLFVGLTGWGFFANCVNTAMPALVGTGPLLKKIYFPAYAPILGAVIGVIIQSGIEVGLVLVVLGILTNVGWTWLLMPVWAFLFVVFSASAAMIFAIANIYFRDLAHIISVFLQLLFYATPILYPENLLNSIPNAPLREVIKANPLAQFIDLFRDLVYSLDAGSFTRWVSAVAWTAVAFGGAVFVFSRFGRDLGEEV
jgi:ABC-type polysaccharide/polyol phosphate export permease